MKMRELLEKLEAVKLAQEEFHSASYDRAWCESGAPAEAEISNRYAAAEAELSALLDEELK